MRAIITLWVQEKLPSQEKTLSQPLDKGFFIYRIIKNT